MNEVVDVPVSANKHVLNRKWVFWYLIPDRSSLEAKWSDLLHPLHSFQTLEDFSLIINSLDRPEHLLKGCKYYVFRYNSVPVWEDPMVRDGFHISVEVDKRKEIDVGERWIDLVYYTIGGNFNGDDKIAGIEFNSRSESWRISLWVSADAGPLDAFTKKMKQIFQLEEVQISQIKSE